MRSIRFRLTVWYAALLGGIILLFGASKWLGLAQCLNRSPIRLAKQVRRIGENFLMDVGVNGENMSFLRSTNTSARTRRNRCR